MIILERDVHGRILEVIKGDNEESRRVWKDAESLEAKINEYFDYCDTHVKYIPNVDYEEEYAAWLKLPKNRPGNKRIYKEYRKADKEPKKFTKKFDPLTYTVSGLALHIGIDRSTLLRYENEHDNLHIRNTIKRAKTRIEKQVEDKLLEGKAPAGTIFHLKNNFKQWKDEKTVDLGGDSLTQILDSIIK